MRGYQQVVERHRHDRSRARRATSSLPVDHAPRSRSPSTAAQPFFRDARVNGVHLRVLAEPFGTGRAVELALPLTEVDSLLSRLRLILALLDLGGIALAALLGRLVAGAAVLPLKRLTQADRARHAAPRT